MSVSRRGLGAEVTSFCFVTCLSLSACTLIIGAQDADDGGRIDGADANGKSLAVRVATESDDCEEEDGVMDLDSTDLDLGHYTVGLRFVRVRIAQGATITEARIQFTAKKDYASGTVVDIRAEDVDDAVGFADDPMDLTGRFMMTEKVPWTLPVWELENDSREAQRTPDLSVMVQRVVNREGWKSGNSLVFQFEIVESGFRTAHSYDGSPESAPELQIRYE